MNLAIVLAGGVDRSAEQRVIPVVLALLRRLTARHTVHVFALTQEPKPARWMLCGAHIHNIGSSRAVHRAVAMIWRAHREVRFDVVQALWAGASSLVGALAARLIDVPFCIHLTGGELVGLRDIGYGQQLSAQWRWLNRRVFARAQRITATSDPMVALAARLGIRATRLPLGIALDEWPALTPRPRHPRECWRLIQVASLSRVKDQSLTLYALQELAARGHEFVMDFVGEDTLHGEFQDLARRLNLHGRTTFHGFLTQRELRPLMERAHLHVVSSRHEAGPAAALEAAVAGVPTAGTAVGHLVEWSDAAALVTPTGDALALANSLHALMSDDAHRVALARAAQDRALAEDADFTAARFEAIYGELLAGGRAG